MKKVTPMARIIDIFSTEPLEACEALLDAAQGIVRNRRTRNSAPTAKRRPRSEPAAATTKEGEAE